MPNAETKRFAENFFGQKRLHFNVEDYYENTNKIMIMMGDITSLKVDAIVNAANNSLSGGGGVDGAIHSIAGPGLLEECRKLKGCPTGEARITSGYKLPAHWVIHTVGPIWRGGNHGEDELLARCYKSCFELVEQREIKSIAFPSISTGRYGFPVERATMIAVHEMESLINKGVPTKVIAVCFNREVFDCYLEALRSI